ncbi:hypothetical protein IWZ01DRAFT_93610 [Phyllosticta capitalensis]
MSTQSKQTRRIRIQGQLLSSSKTDGKRRKQANRKKMTDAKREKSEQRGEIIPTYPTIHAGTTKLHSRGARRRKSNTAGPAIEPCPSRIVVSPNPISPTARPLPSILHHSHTRLSHSNGRARRRAALGIYSKSLQPNRLICARARSPYTYTQRKRKRSWRLDPTSMCPMEFVSRCAMCVCVHRVHAPPSRRVVDRSPRASLPPLASAPPGFCYGAVHRAPRAHHRHLTHRIAPPASCRPDTVSTRHEL